jgi:hypothetical protein
MGWAYNMNGRGEKYTQGFNRKPERERENNGRIECGLHDNIKVHLIEMGSQNVNWIDVAEERVY